MYVLYHQLSVEFHTFVCKSIFGATSITFCSSAVHYLPSSHLYRSVRYLSAAVGTFLSEVSSVNIKKYSLVYFIVYVIVDSSGLRISKFTSSLE